MSSAVLHRSPDVRTREVDGIVFLINEADGTIAYLNDLGGALWRALADPTTQACLTALFVQAFPDRSPDRISRDIAALLVDMEGRDLIATIS